MTEHVREPSFVAKIRDLARRLRVAEQRIRDLQARVSKLEQQ